MHAIISLLVLFWAISKASNALKYQNVKRIQSAETCYKIRNTDYERQRKQALQAAKQREKELLQAEKRRQQKEQAQADKAFLIQQLDLLSDMLIQADEELNRINQAINIDIATRSYDKEIKDRKRKEQVVKKIMVLETRQHTLESKLAKCQYTIDGP